MDKKQLGLSGPTDLTSSCSAISSARSTAESSTHKGVEERFGHYIDTLSLEGYVKKEMQAGLYRPCDFAKSSSWDGSSMVDYARVSPRQINTKYQLKDKMLGEFWRAMRSCQDQGVNSVGIAGAIQP